MLTVGHQMDFIKRPTVQKLIKTWTVEKPHLLLNCIAKVAGCFVATNEQLQNFKSYDESIHSHGLCLYLHLQNSSPCAMTIRTYKGA